MNVSLLLAAALFLAAPATPPAPPATDLALVNPGFEAAAVGQDIPGWTQLQHAGVEAYDMGIDSKVVHSGKHAFRMHRRVQQVYGLLTQSVPAAGMAEKTVEISAWLRVEAVGPQGWGLSINFITASGDIAVQENSPPLSGTSKKWQLVTVRKQVPPGVVRLDVGLMLSDGGTAWADDVRIRVLDH